MPLAFKNEPFTVKVTGEITGEEFAGTFECRPVLPHDLQMEQDRLRRKYLGDEKPDTASPRAKNQAQVFSDLHVALTKAPSWWSEFRDGMGLLDDNVVSAVYDGYNKIVNTFITKLKEDKKKAQKDLAGMTAPEPAGMG